MFQRSYRCANQQVFFISWTRWAVRWNFSSERTPSGFEVPPSFKIVDSWRCSVLVVGLVTTILQRINWLVKSVQSRLFEISKIGTKFKGFRTSIDLPILDMHSFRKCVIVERVQQREKAHDLDSCMSLGRDLLLLRNRSRVNCQRYTVWFGSWY